MTKAKEIAEKALLNHTKVKTVAGDLGCSNKRKIAKAKSLVKETHGDFVDHLTAVSEAIVQTLRNTSVEFFEVDGPRRTRIDITLMGYVISINVLDIEITSVMYQNFSKKDQPSIDVSDELDVLTANLINDTRVFQDSKSRTRTLIVSNAACVCAILSSLIERIRVEAKRAAQVHDAELRQLKTRKDLSAYVFHLDAYERDCLWDMLGLGLGDPNNTNVVAHYLDIHKSIQEKSE